MSNVRLKGKPDRRGMEGRMTMHFRLDTAKPEQKWLFEWLEEMRVTPGAPYKETTIREALTVFLSLIEGNPEPLFQAFPMLRPHIQKQAQPPSNGHQVSTPASESLLQSVESENNDDFGENFLIAVEDLFNED
jgi:hypothetical protein